MVPIPGRDDRGVLVKGEIDHPPYRIDGKVAGRLHRRSLGAREEQTDENRRRGVTEKGAAVRARDPWVGFRSLAAAAVPAPARARARERTVARAAGAG